MIVRIIIGIKHAKNVKRKDTLRKFIKEILEIK